MAEKFYPSLVIFVDEIGRQIYDQFSFMMLSVGLAEPLRKFVGLIHNTLADAQFATYRLINDILSSDVQKEEIVSGQITTSLSGTTTMLESAIENMWQLLSLDIDKNTEEIRDAECPMPERRIQVYIVGPANSAAMNYVLRTMRTQLSGESAKEADVYLLLSTNSSSSSNTTLDSAATSYQADPLVKFSSTLEEKQVPKNEAYSAVAQALCTLITTGITSQYTFERQIHPEPHPDGNGQIGYVITNLHTLPYTVLEDYCCAYLGSELMSQWRIDIRKGTTSKEKTAQQLSVQQSVGKIRQWMESNPSRPKELHELFSRENVDREFKNCKEPSDTWADVVCKVIDEKVPGMYEGWALEVEEKVCAQVREVIEQIWLSNINGYSLIYAYIAKLKEQLETLFCDWCKIHKDRYQTALRNFETTWGPFDKTTNTPLGGTDNQLPTEVKRVGEPLRHYLASEQVQVPSAMTVIVAGFLVIPPPVLIVLTLFPAWSVLPIIGGIVGFVLLCNMLFRSWRRREVVRVREALLEVYHLYLDYAYGCEFHKDSLREKVEGSLRKMLRTEDERSRNVKGLIAQIETKLLADANKARDSLFDSSKASRGVPIGGIQENVSDAKNTLQDLAERIAWQHYDQSDQGYERNRFFKSLQDGLVKIAEMDENDAYHHVHNLVEPIIKRYFEDRSLTKITGLDDMTLQHFSVLAFAGGVVTSSK